MNKKNSIHRFARFLKAALLLSITLAFMACPNGFQEIPGEEIPSYTVSFSANGGSGNMNSITVQEGTIITLSECPFTKSGKMFVAWNTSEDGFGISYLNETSFIVTKDITLYAQWAVPHTVTFNANGGTGSNYTQTVPENISTFLVPSTFTYDGKILAGWNTEADESGESYSDESPVIMSEDVTLYAIWKTPCNVTFSTNGGNSINSQVVAEGNRAQEPVTPQKQGYRFMGWYSDSELATPFSFVTPIIADTTLYASWKKIFTITYDANGAEGEMQAQTLLEGDEITLRENSFTLTDYGFACWNTSSDGSGDRYDAGETITPTENLTLYAQWGLICTISFNKNSNDAEGEMEDISIPAGSSLTLPANEFSYSGHYCSGWNTAANGSGTAYTNGQTIILSETTVLYAQWRVGNGVFYTVTLADCDHGSVRASATSGMAGDFITLSITPDTNYVVDAITVTGSSGNIPLTEIEENASYQFAMPESNVSVQVALAQNTRTLSFDANYAAAGGSTTAITDTVDSSVTVPECGFTREDWTAISWNTEEDGSGTEYLPGDSITLNDNIILYAQWREGYVTTVAKLADTLTYIKNLGKTTAKVVITDATNASIEGSVTTSGSTTTKTPGTIGSAIKAESTLNINLVLDYNSGLTEIGDAAFDHCENLKSVEFASNVTTLGDYAFASCSGITSMDISYITEIGSYALSYTGLTSITIPAAITSLDTGTFMGSDLTSVYFASGSSLTSLGPNAFELCTNLRTITLPANLETIGAEAFRRCSALTGINIPSKVESIGSWAFAYSGLTSIKIPSTVKRVYNSVCYQCESLTKAEIYINEYNSDGTWTSNEIQESAFENCKNLTTVKLSCSAPDRAFNGCPKLSSVTFTSNHISYIGDFAFSGCSFTSINLPAIIENAIGSWAFNECKQLTTVKLPADVHKINDRAFEDCTELATVTFANTTSSNSLIYIGYHAFANTKVSSITIPPNVYKIGKQAFGTNLTSLTFSPANGASSNDGKWYKTDVPSYFEDRDKTKSSVTAITGFASMSAGEKAALLTGDYYLFWSY